jgi:glycolate oxidase iron-sulfur subunit
MQTRFTPAQLADPDTAASEKEIRTCVHCGFCLATCPTYALLGDELDSPRGRIWLIQDMLENDRTPSAEVVKHVDRCLSCLACETTCPSGVKYHRLVDHARTRIEERYNRPWLDRLIRSVLAAVLPYPERFRAAMLLGVLAKPFAPLFRAIKPLRPLAAMLDLSRLPAPRRPAPVLAARGRVALLQGCAEPALRPEIRAAATRLLARAGFAVVPAPGEGCCGALTHHLGKDPLDFVRRNVDAWTALIEGQGLDAIVVAAAGCGTMVKDYGYLLREDPAYAAKAARVSALARDALEFLDAQGLPQPEHPARGAVAYQAPCSLQHGQKVKAAPVRLLTLAGYTVTEPAEAHLCCGSAGSYNILQPQIAGRLRDRKLADLAATQAPVIASANIGCMTQLASGTATPVFHVLELLDRAHHGR